MNVTDQGLPANHNRDIITQDVMANVTDQGLIDNMQDTTEVSCSHAINSIFVLAGLRCFQLERVKIRLVYIQNYLDLGKLRLPDR